MNHWSPSLENQLIKSAEALEGRDYNYLVKNLAPLAEIVGKAVAMEAYRAVARNASIILAVSLQLSVCSWCCELKWRSLEEGFEVSQSERKRLQEPRCIGRRGKNECIPARVVDELLPPVVVNGNDLAMQKEKTTRTQKPGICCKRRSTRAGFNNRFELAPPLGVQRCIPAVRADAIASRSPSSRLRQLPFKR